jgi:hypothetical protein
LPCFDFVALAGFGVRAAVAADLVFAAFGAAFLAFVFATRRR